ncbi:Helix-turn-helix domain-containing protein [Streptomyces sp. 1331.2]|nr:Helix-turn-helix domain-containing protein [Streptomyces sp. 1331.2]
MAESIMAPNSLGDYLRARRALVSPAEAGLPATGRRRVPGLRREEVAELVGLSIDYYVRLEQGRADRPSGEVLDALTAAPGASTAAAPQPWTARAASTSTIDGASATSSDIAPTRAIPASSIRRRPYRSARLPVASGSAAKPMLKALSIHCALPTEEPRSAAMTGRATAAPVTEKGSISAEEATAMTVGRKRCPSPAGGAGEADVRSGEVVVMP